MMEKVCIVRVWWAERPCADPGGTNIDNGSLAEVELHDECGGRCDCRSTHLVLSWRLVCPASPTRRLTRSVLVESDFGREDQTTQVMLFFRDRN